MAHLCKQIEISGDLLNSKRDIPNVHFNVYRCGSCSSLFETICVLHEHMLCHISGGSYHYDHSFLTAFPKYDSICTGSQTDFGRENLVQNISTGSQTDLDLNTVNNIFNLLNQSNIADKHYPVSSDCTNIKTRRDIELKNKEIDLKKDRGLGYLHDFASGCHEKTNYSEVSDETDVKRGYTETTEERMIKVEKNDESIMESIDDVQVSDYDHDSYQSQRSIGKSYSEIYDPGHKILFERKKRYKVDRVVIAIGSTNENQIMKDNVENLVAEKSVKKCINRCKICEKQFNTLRALKRHLTIVHSDERIGKSVRTYQCKYCDFNLRSKKELLEHVKEDHSETDKTFSCSYCEEELLTYATKSEHMDSKHPEIVQVLKNFHQSKDKDSHTACDLCGKLFSTAAGLALHMSSFHLKKKFKCDICNVELSQKYTLKAHKIEKHHENMRGFDCNTCKKTFAYKFRLRAHIKQMHNSSEEIGNKFICESCGYFSKSKAGLRYHLTKHDDNRKQFQCSICPYKTYYKCSLTEHVASHEGNRKFICEVCGDKFHTSKQLKVHMRRHTGELPYHCDICSKKFRTDIAYARHRDIHLKNMRFKCDYCEKEFVQKTNCLAHMRQHTGEKPFKCDWCGLGFTHNVSRKNHMNKCNHKPLELSLVENIAHCYET